MSTAKKMLKSVRIIILVVFLILSLVAIYPDPNAKGVAIRSVAPNSTATLAGIESPKPTTAPMSREVITAINNIPIANEADYFEQTSDLRANQTVQVKTTKGFYQLTVQPKYKITELNETEEKIVEEILQVNKTYRNKKTGELYNKTVNETINKTIEVPKVLREVVGVEPLGLRVYDAPVTNIRKGLDLQGGTRVLLRPEKKVNSDDMGIILDNLKERLNVFGLSDVIVREASDLEGNQFILVEIAGADEEEVRDLISKQGKFEAKVGNSTVFVGGNDITYVCRSADCSGIDPRRGCGKSSEGQFNCAFRFTISLSPEAADKQAEVTKDLEVISDENGQAYLSQKLQLFLDDSLVDELSIGEDLKGRAVTDIQISGGGQGSTEQEALTNTLASMKRLQTILITGSLPVKLEVMKTDAISPVLGKDFVKNAFTMALIAILMVAIIIFLRYRMLKVAVPMIITMLSEVVLIFGIASLIQWNIDMAAVAGIIVAVGTGVDDQIVIADETLRGKSSKKLGWKEKLKRAFFIIMVAYFTSVASMVPLLFAGAGLLKGFALTTILGISIGVFITRPAYAALVEILINK